MTEHIYGICSSYFNPLHDGHLKYIEESYLYIHEEAGYEEDDCSLFLIINNDEQVKLKNSIPFLNQEIRQDIVAGLTFVDDVFLSIDQDESVAKTIEQIIKVYAIQKELGEQVYFFNSGDQKEPNPQEDEICRQYGIEQVFLDLPKINSSSEILDKVGQEWHERYMRSMTPMQDSVG